jgi:hypothetical protein
MPRIAFSALNDFTWLGDASTLVVFSKRGLLPMLLEANDEDA